MRENEDHDPKRDKMYIEKILKVSSNRIKMFASRQRRSMTMGTNVEKNEDELSVARNERQKRSRAVEFLEKTFLDLAAHCFGIDEDEVFQFYLDEPNNLEILKSICVPDASSKSVFIHYQTDFFPSKESGRYLTYDQRLKFKKGLSVIFSTGHQKPLDGKFVALYRNNKMKCDDNAYFTIATTKGPHVIMSAYEIFKEILYPSVSVLQNYGMCSEILKQHFLFDVRNMVNFLKNVSNNLAESQIEFPVNEDIYKGFFLTDEKIAENSKKREKVYKVEEQFCHWLKQMRVVICHGTQLYREAESSGPLRELENWRRLVSKFEYIEKFTKTRVFRNYRQVLIITKSKLLVEWKKVESSMRCLLIEASDNVKFVESIKDYWAPLYRCDPKTITLNLQQLLRGVRNVYDSSTYFNTSLRISSFLTMVSNQLIRVSQGYLSINKSIWSEDMDVLVQKINECNEMMETYIKVCEIAGESKDGKEKIFGCSPNFLFKRLNLFINRLCKIREIMHICLEYRMLSSINMCNFKFFWQKIDAAFVQISAMTYDPLDYQIEQFEQDFTDFLNVVAETEIEMEGFLKVHLDEIPTAESKIIFLQRFEKLNLKCLYIAKRYTEIAEVLLNEIKNVKDKYNEERGRPPLQRNVPAYAARIYWIRNLYNRMNYPLKYLIKYPCTLKHFSVQNCIKMFNSIAPILFTDQATTHKAWYIYVDQIHSKLESPILKRNPKTNRYEINLNPYVMQAVKEGECMKKLGLEVPKSYEILTYWKDHILEAYYTLKELMRRHDELRSSIYPIFLPLMRIHLIKLERIFKPAFENVTWLSLDLQQYFQRISDVLEPIEDFLKVVSDINDMQIDNSLNYVENMILIDLPNDPVPPETLLEINNQHRVKMQSIIEIKSTAVEKSAVELINAFVEKADCVPIRDNSGKFQLPPDQVNETNRHLEEIKPINKYDWLSFGKMFQPVTYASDDDNQINVFKHYEGLHYDVTQLHIDCMELFAYYNQKAAHVFSKATLRSMELLDERSQLTTIVRTYDCNESECKPLLLVELKLEDSEFKLCPSLKITQEKYDQVLLNIMETFCNVSSWGQQAKIKEKNKYRKLVAEVIYEKDWFKTVFEHKDVARKKITFNNGIVQLQPELDKMLKELQSSFNYLWPDDMKAQIEDFVKRNPLTPDIRDRLSEYDQRSEELLKLERFICFASILIDRNRMIECLVQHSKSWKKILGRKLCDFYGIIVDKNVAFIAAQNKILDRELQDLGDCRIAMECLRAIRENFIDIDQNLNLMEETYQMFQRFGLNIPSEDFDRVYSLRFKFKMLIQKSKTVGEKISSMQEPLLNELTAGVEKFKKDVATFDEDFDKKGPMVDGISAREASDRVLIIETHLDNLQHQYEVYSSGEELFGLPISDYPVLQKRKREISYLNRLYKLYLDVMHTVDQYFTLHFTYVDMDRINGEIQEFVTRCRLLPKGMKTWPAFIDLKKKIDDFYECCPLIELMTSNAMKDRHWESLEKILKYKFDRNDISFTLGYVLEAPLLEHKEEVEEICISAGKELDIETKLRAVIEEWKSTNMPLAKFKSRGEILIKASDVQDIITKLEDSLMVMNSLASNRFNVPFKKDIMLWLKRLSDTNEILEKWLQVQSLWMYLEAVFVGGDIAKELPDESKRFDRIDRGWTVIMYKTRNNLNIVNICTEDERISSDLSDLLDQLEITQKSLTVYLESKRLIFPRFFFVSDPVLLEILGQASDPNSIQPHLLSIFDGVAQVEFSQDDTDTVVAIFSSNGEKINLQTPVKCIGLVENWINKLLKSVLETVKCSLSDLGAQIGDAKFDYKSHLPTLCAQAQLICIQLVWTKDAEFALSNCRRDKKIMARKNLEMQDMLNFLVDQTVKNLTKLERISCETLVTIHVHQRDIFDELVRSKVKSPNDFEWQKQARFYYETNLENVLVKITDIDFVYQNEYLGVTERLAITPLTDRCYITLAQAIGMNMGGAPAGPAGTGKTETTKDMGRALGKLVVVFNCSDQMDFRGLGRIFKGLAQSGSWGCFDEFNRIELPVLSVAAQQIYIVLHARKEKLSKFIFSDGDVVKMNPEFGLFITMNPGYAGRQELPENLKIQFRTVAMMIPDRQIIMRVKLASCGFRDNVKLAAKFYTLYKLCEEQLSKQVHYDFGLRNILSVLRTLGAEKRAASRRLQEDEIVMQVLRNMNLSKLVDEDEPLFLSLIADLFPKLKLQTSARNDLQVAISVAVAKLKLINHPAWNLKIIQLYETSLVRHGLMVLGPTGAGKSRCIATLLSSLTIQGRPHKELRMNPKAITAPQMFGRLDVTTNDWTDGIFSVLWRRTLKFKNEYVWLTLDGPVDAVWIENLNSVLDDNKTLTLANGDRIVMSPNCKLVFEPDAIDNASPATVSRMGMVFMSSSVLPWDIILDGWLLSRSPEESKSFKKFFAKIYGDLHLFVQTKLSAKMKLLEAIYIRQTCDVLSGLLDESSGCTEAHLEKIFLFAVMWSLGAVLELDDRDKMEEFVKSHPSKMKWPKVESGESMFEFLVDKNGNWQHWNTQIEEYVYPSNSVPDYSSILVPNVDNVRTAFLIDTIAKQNKSVLLIGEQGTAKTVMIKSYMQNKCNPEVHLSKSFNFSSATTPNMFQRIIESYVEKRIGLTYGPPQMRKMTVFIDDINMPIVNEWGDQVTNEIVRQLMEYSGFYSLDRPGDFINIVDVQLIAAMIHAGGGRNDIPSRLKRHFNVFNCTLPSDKSMDKIFSVIGSGYFCLSRFNAEIVYMIWKLIPLTRKLWQQTKIKMLPTPAKFHYIFNLRDLSRIWGGMLKIEKQQCKSVGSLLKLWSHECTRVIADRLIDTEDRDWFKAKMQSMAKAELGDDYEQFPDDDVYFVDFMRDEPDELPEMEHDESIAAQYFVYEEIPSFEAVTDRIYSFMTQYNQEVRGSKLDLVLFQDALIHLMIISRIIRTSRGNALLVGVGGSGKQSLTKLASYIAGYRSHQITLTRAYNINDFVEEFKELYRVAGGAGQGISFIFTDNDIKDESFLEYLNNVLSSGEIANLFAKDEIDEILSELIPVMKKADPKRIPTQENLYDFFISRARNNLHVVLCFSPVGEKFRNRALKFPGLISGCTIDWFQKWPMDALVSVSTHLLKNYKMECSSEVKTDLIETMAFVHDNVSQTCVDYFERFRRQASVTPKSFLSFLSAYKIIYNERLANIQDQSMKMSNGLGKLKEAAESIDVLKTEMEEKKKEIVIAEKNAMEVIKSVEESRQIASEAQIEVKAKKEIQEELVKNLTIVRGIAEEELEKTLPQLKLAEDALKTIKSQDIAVVRKLGKPPYLITVIMDCVLILSKLRLEPVKIDWDKKFLTMSWSESTKMMSDTGFLNKIRGFKQDSIDAETIDLLQPYFRLPNYTIESAMTACGQVAGLLKWTIAMAEFYKVNVNVIPLKADLAMKQNQFERAELEYAELQETLALKNAEKDAAELQFKVANDALLKVKADAQLLQSKLDAAQAMITGLSDERIRWTEQIGVFKREIEKLVGDSLILTGFLSYTGPFNQLFRAKLQTVWQDELTNREIPYSANIDVIERLTDTATVGEWNLQGLPNDELSIQNGIIVTQAHRYPLLIDPQSQGKAWIKQKEKENLIVTTLSHRHFRDHLENAIQQGLPILIEDVGEELDPCLDNVLEKNYIKMGMSYKLKVGDKEIDISPGFRLFMTTKLSNPLYSPEISARTSIIDFTVTMRGLEDQLLGRVILSERQSIEAERVQLDQDVTINKKLTKELEANLLYKLSTTEGSLLDDLSVMEVLNNSKAKSLEIKEKLEIAEETKININLAREEFRPVAARGSVLYFLIVKMSLVNNMYQTSLVQFLERFDYSLQNSKKSLIAFKRINDIIDFLTYDIFTYKSRGLYETHKFLFVLLMALDIDLQQRKISFEEFQTFIKGGAALDINSCPKKPFKWIADITWLNAVQLSSVRFFENILDDVSRNDKAWKKWYESNAPEAEVIPDGYNSYEPFKRLLIIRSFCLDRTLSQSRKYIASSLGPRFAESVVLDYESMLEESRPLTPIICFLSMGSDPTPSIESLAKKNQVKVSAISMGQGQELHARKLIANSLKEGSWVLLQNCHLGLEYMNELTLLFIELEKAEEGFHEMFRLWITTEVHPGFPITMLQMSIKFTNEPPSGMRAGLKRTYNSMSMELFDSNDSPFYLPLIYTTSFLHSVVQERRKFGALGWNIPYEFNSSDWLASCLFMQRHLWEETEINWKTVNYMIGEVQYGGRVTDDYDKRLLNCLSRSYFSSKLFDDDFEFYKGYKIVVRKSAEEYIEFFDTMQETDSPNVYGLHSNADITFQRNKTKEILDTIISVQPKESTGGAGETREAAVTRQVKDMLSRLPPLYDEFEVRQRLTREITPMNIFLRQEIDRIQRIIKLVKATLDDLLLAIEGTIIMSENLRDAFDNIYDARVPRMWTRGSWFASTLGFWFTELIERNIQFSNWCFKGQPMAYWMTGFFNPQGFLTAIRQETARANNGWALDKVILQNEVKKFSFEDCQGPPKTGVYVHGLYLDGASWSRREMKLVEATNKVLYTPMPIIRIYANNVFDAKGQILYECPVYKKANRTDLNFITALRLPSKENPDHWVLRGVALLCDIK